MSAEARWRLRRADPKALAELGAAGRWPELSCRILAARGIASPEEAAAFLARELCLHPPRLLRGMETAVARLATAWRRGERVGILGDYDVDGVTATVLLLKLCGLLELACEWHIPDRLRDGYGPNPRALEKFRARGCTVVVTVDCGISALAEATKARELGLDLIVTDHHVPGPVLPDCLAVVNPKTSPDYPYSMLAGVGVAWKLAQALLEELAHPRKDAFLDHMLELVALGTICDVAPLDGENRALVREGLARLRDGRWLGLRCLGAVAGVRPESLEAGALGFQLGPRLNAGGRIGNAGLGVELLLSKDKSRSEALARELDALNRERRDIEKAVLDDAELQAQPALARDAPALVLWNRSWHPGVVGLAASRLLERHHRPVFVFGVDADGLAKGSARARKPFHLVRALEACAPHLLKFGGHEVAAGATLRAESLPAFARDFEAQAAELSPEERRPVLSIDVEWNPAWDPAGALDTLAAFEPHGLGNPRPLFLARGLRLLEGSRPVGGSGSHLKARLGLPGGGRADAIAWRMGERCETLLGAGPLDAVFHLGWNEWNGRRAVQWELRDLRPAGGRIEGEGTA